MTTDANIVTGPPDPGPCPQHPGCFILRCHNMWCRHLIHRKDQRGQPRRFCSTRCRVAHHRGNR